MKIRLIATSLLISATCLAQVRREVNINKWQFSRNNTEWQQVTVPHDWAISGPFDKKWDLQTVAITQNGEKEKTEKSGRSGALPWIGEGFYKTTFSIPSEYGHAMLKFDGAMSEPTVYINGHKAGYWAYGYNAFRVDATPFINKDGKINTIEVQLKNVEESSRWYPGGGIYRPVTLIMTGDTNIDRWGTYIRTNNISNGNANIAIDTHVHGYENMQGLRAEISIIDVAGKIAAKSNSQIDKLGNMHSEQNITDAKLWSPESPYLYRVVTKLYSGDKLIDETTDKTGIRTISVSADKGFMLNGISRKIQGVCLHHDLGPLGAAVNKAAIIRQIRILKDMGCDAIRTSHNMPSTMQMEVCDSMGMMVMAESFDMWKYPKCKNGYAKFFDNWADRDITNLVLNHRNHPSIVMWSIGNEIPEQGSVEGREISRHLQDICHRLDPSRPVTQGMDKAENAIASGFAKVMDVPGFNYRVYKYDTSIKNIPQGFILGSETASTVSSRGIYKFPVKITDNGVYPDGQCSSYDTEYCSWSNLPEADFLMQDDRNYSIGQFVWTGFDYLGEPTPYDTYWPSRSSYFGICDLAGLAKDRFYLYRSLWNKTKHTLHVLPHWTWPGREGQVTPVFVYTDYPSAELFVNGKSQGKQFKQPYSVAAGSSNAEKPQLENMELLRRYRLMWDNVKYEPGEIKVVAYKANGEKAEEKIICTAGKPAKLEAKADRNEIKADGNDLAFVTISLTDKKGNLIPDGSDELTFDVQGAGSFKAACNGDATSLESFTQPQMKLFSGKLVVIVESNGKKGDILLTVKDKKLGKTVKTKIIAIP